MRALVLFFVVLGITAFVYSEQTSKQTSDPILFTTVWVENQRYIVRDTSNKQQAALLLHNITRKLGQLVRHLRQLPIYTIPETLQPGIERLLKTYSLHGFRLSELDVSVSPTVAFNEEKGKRIYLCLRTCRHCETLAPENVVFLVALHEIAHSATEKYGEKSPQGFTDHSTEFHQYETYLINTAENLRLLKYNEAIGTSFCSLSIPDTRLHT